jgi:hypothetical protein
MSTTKLAPTSSSALPTMIANDATFSAKYDDYSAFVSAVSVTRIRRALLL